MQILTNPNASPTARRLLSYIRNAPYFSNAQTKLSMRFIASQLIAGEILR